jgi:hypothetical protein
MSNATGLKIVLPFRRGELSRKIGSMKESFAVWMWQHREGVTLTLIVATVLTAAIYVASLYPPR